MLTVKELLPKDGPRRKWLCKCDCGSICTPTTSNLRTGNSTSCGCQTQLNAGNAVAKHGGKTAAPIEYHAWEAMRGRDTCTPEWDDFVQFFCDVGERPSPKHRLTRKDGQKPHGPTNTYWRNADDYRDLTATDLGGEFVVDLRSLALAEATARQREEPT